jgi:hypothetical protein
VVENVVCCSWLPVRRQSRQTLQIGAEHSSKGETGRGIVIVRAMEAAGRAGRWTVVRGSDGGSIGFEEV